MENEKPVLKRLESLDVLRGLDLFCLVVLESTFHMLAGVLQNPAFDRFMWCFRHVEWEGFSSWDLVMPLFLFMSGVSIPFSLGRCIASPDKRHVYWKIAKRVFWLWLLGMLCQGNLRALDPQHLSFFSNTLQAIAVGYLIAAVIFLNARFVWQVIWAFLLLLVYWGCMTFVSVDGFGRGNYTPEGNLAEWVDRAVLGRFRDGVQWENGVWSFAPGYRYTWILSSLNFGVTVLTGLFAGTILKREGAPLRKVGVLLLVGVASVVVGWLWGLEHPVIKKLWTGSMVLVSSGYCFLLMALFYYWIDCKGHRRGWGFLKIYGMNSIAAYVLTMVVSFWCIGESLFFGLKPYLGAYYLLFMNLCNVGVIFGILWLLYRNKIFLRV